MLCAKIGNLISGTSLEEIRKAWKIEEDITEQTKAEIKVENKMLEDVDKEQ